MNCGVVMGKLCRSDEVAFISGYNSVSKSCQYFYECYLERVSFASLSASFRMSLSDFRKVCIRKYHIAPLYIDNRISSQ